MIRIPFSTRPELGGSNDRSVEPYGSSKPASPEQLLAIEARMAALELKLAIHAEEIQDGVLERVERIESRFRNAVKSFNSEGGSEGTAENVVEFHQESPSSHELRASNAREALNELNATLLVTRKHLEALGASVARMRAVVSSGQ